mgnify:CR=1 FL=1
MLDALKRELKELIGDNRHEEVFRRLTEEVLLVNSDLYNDAILLESKHRESVRAGNLSLIAFEEKNINFSNTSQALIWLVNNITPAVLGDKLRQKAESFRSVPALHAFTCDRVAQNEFFQLNYYDTPGPEQKLRFFYLYGDARQEHESLFKRLGYEIGGHLLNWEKGDYNPGTKIKFVDCKPPVHDNPKLFQINVMRELLARFFEPVNNLQPILSKKLNEVLTSPELKDFGANDLVFILLTIDDHNWREQATPLVVKSLVEGFCACELPPGSPNFFFFFGIEYQKTNETVKAQVRKAIQERAHGESLPELQPVSLREVSEWFSRYDVLRMPGQEPEAAAAEMFPGATELDMADIEIKLQERIERYNKGLV